MTTFAIVPIDQVAPHPRNIRRSAVADEELVSSVLEAGIHEPVLLGPEDATGSGSSSPGTAATTPR